jgi:hypothetical protein
MHKKGTKLWSFLFNEWGTVIDNKFQSDISWEYPLLVEFESKQKMMYTDEGLKFKWDKNKDLYSEEIKIPNDAKIKNIKVKDELWSFTMGKFGKVIYIDETNILMIFPNKEAMVGDLEVEFKLKYFQREFFKKALDIPQDINQWNIHIN